MVKQKEIKKIERDIDLENTLGNICIAQFQLQKLYDRLGNKFGNSVGTETNERATQFTINYGGNLFRITMIAEKMAIAKPTDNDEPATTELGSA